MAEYSSGCTCPVSSLSSTLFVDIEVAFKGTVILKRPRGQLCLLFRRMLCMRTLLRWPFLHGGCPSQAQRSAGSACGAHCPALMGEERGQSPPLEIWAVRNLSFLLPLSVLAARAYSNMMITWTLVWNVGWEGGRHIKSFDSGPFNPEGQTRALHSQDLKLDNRIVSPIRDFFFFLIWMSKNLTSQWNFSAKILKPFMLFHLETWLSSLFLLFYWPRPWVAYRSSWAGIEPEPQQW